MTQRDTRTTTDGNGETIYLGCLVTFFAPLPEDEGTWRVKQIVRKGRKGTVVFLENEETHATTAAYRNHLEVK